MNAPLPRRHFIKTSLAFSTLAATGSWSALAAPAPAPGVRLGGPTFIRTDDPEELAKECRRLGYGAAYCPNIKITDTDRIRATTAAFAKHDVVIAEVGRWVNLMDANPEQRKKNLELVTEGLALAEAVGARCCVDIAGSFNPKVWYGPHPDNLSERFLEAAVENARKIIDAVKPTRAKFCYEMMGWSLPDSVESNLRLLKAVDRPAFGVHLDPCNLINSPERFYRNTALLHECFDKLGPHIASCHAKDLFWEVEMNVHFREVIPGKGALDYTTFLQRLAALPQQPPLMMEHLNKAEEYAEAARYIKEVGAQAGIPFLPRTSPPQ
ncbi:sugar phosphate isomerase/epimerase [Fontisphaera persica]|uniref:sugar phosphate isomerase/epimerase family protein n=1 Tax=Fontisphaera persica TaxID=2974023 RepID=UPI0024C0D0C5|nr:sugar phosphate isomerase/epimerase family protein [Fontisphaera persica]WCJ59336.1 sugar phosphate isomerase/epimerase [Fontisphaera persica]